MSSKASNTRKREREEEDLYLARGAKLIRVSEAQDLQLQVPDNENPFKIEFFQHEDTYVILPYYKIRMTWSEYHGCYFVYMCRENVKKGISVLRWSILESGELLVHLETFLKNLENHPKTGKQALEILDMFKEKESNLFEHEMKNWSQYWKAPDFETDNLRIRWSYRKSTNSYTLILHSPVRDDRKLKNWEGPQFYLNVPSIKALVLFLRFAQKEGKGKLEDEGHATPQLQ